MGDKVHARAHQLTVSIGAVICFPWFTCWPSVRLDLPWRTFTLSWPLQPGVWLLRRLRPLSRTLAFSRLLRARRCERSLISYREVIATLSMPALRRADDGVALIGQRTQQANRRAILARGCQPFPPSLVTTLAQVSLRGQAPFVSIGRRDSPIWPVRLGPADTLSAGFPPQRVPLSDAGRSPLVPLPRYGSLSNSSISEQAHALAQVDAHHLRPGGKCGVRSGDGERHQQREARFGAVIPEFGPADLCSLPHPGHMAALALRGEEEAPREGQDPDLACRFEGVVASIHVGHGWRDGVGRFVQAREPFPGPPRLACLHVLVSRGPQSLVGGAYLPEHTCTPSARANHAEHVSPRRDRGASAGWCRSCHAQRPAGCLMRSQFSFLPIPLVRTNANETWRLCP